MAEINRTSKSKEIKALLLVIASGIFAAVVLSIGMLFWYNPPGSYVAGSMLIDPSALESMHYSEATKRGGDNTPYVFGGVEYTYLDPSSKKWEQHPVPIERYQRFYVYVAKERSLLEVSPEIKEAFSINPMSSLVIRSKRDSGNGSRPEDFINVDFSADGNYYRIQLRADKSTEDGYAYFYHAGIGGAAHKIFIGE